MDYLGSRFRPSRVLSQPASWFFPSFFCLVRIEKSGVGTFHLCFALSSSKEGKMLLFGAVTVNPAYETEKKKGKQKQMNEKLALVGTAYYFGCDRGEFNGKPYFKVRVSPENTSTFHSVDLSCTEEVYKTLLSCPVGTQISCDFEYSEFRSNRSTQKRLRVVRVEF